MFCYIQDGRRIYRLLPGGMRVKFWMIFLAQIMSAFTETCALLGISLFAVSVAALEVLEEKVMPGPLLALFPNLPELLADHRRLVAWTTILMVGSIIFKNLLAVLATHKTAAFAESVSLHIGRETLRRYLGKSYLWHVSPAGPAAFHKFGLREGFSEFLAALLHAYGHVFCCLALFACLILAQPGPSLAVLAIFGAGSLGVYLFLGRRLDRAGREAVALVQAESAEGQAMFQALREVSGFGRRDVFFRKMAESMVAGRRIKTFQAQAARVPAHVLEIIGFGAIALVTGAQLARGAPMGAVISSASMLMLTAWRVLPAVSQAFNYNVIARSYRPAALACLELLETFEAEDETA